MDDGDGKDMELYPRTQELVKDGDVSNVWAWKSGNACWKLVKRGGGLERWERFGSQVTRTGWFESTDMEKHWDLSSYNVDTIGHVLSDNIKLWGTINHWNTLW